jgi:hypothetical protein
VSLATFMQYGRPPVARLWKACLWKPMSAVHRRLAPGLLLEAHRSLQPGPFQIDR